MIYSIVKISVSIFFSTSSRDIYASLFFQNSIIFLKRSPKECLLYFFFHHLVFSGKSLTTFFSYLLFASRSIFLFLTLFLPYRKQRFLSYLLIALIIFSVVTYSHSCVCYLQFQVERKARKTTLFIFRFGLISLN